MRGTLLKDSTLATIVLGTIVAFFFLVLFALQPVWAETKSDDRLQDPAADRLLWSPTALHKGKGQTSITNYDLLVWNFEHSFSESFTLGLRTLTPIGVVMVGPMMKASVHLGPFIHLGLFGEGGYARVFAIEESGDDFSILYLGGGPILTLGGPDYSMNVSALLYGAGRGDSWGTLFLPNAGSGIRLGKRVKLNLELFSPTNPRSLEQVWALLYGLRIFGERIYGDIGFVAPLGRGTSDSYRVMPLGFPLLSFGFSW